MLLSVSLLVLLVLISIRRLTLAFLIASNSKIRARVRFSEPAYRRPLLSGKWDWLPGSWIHLPETGDVDIDLDPCASLLPDTSFDFSKPFRHFWEGRSSRQRYTAVWSPHLVLWAADETSSHLGGCSEEITLN